MAKYKKIPQILKARKTQATPQQVQHRLFCSPRKFIKKFLTQAAQKLVVNHLFSLPHAFHVYNEQGEKDITDTLLLGKESENWLKAVENELGRLANGIDNRLRATNTI